MFFKGSLEVGGRKIIIENWLNLKPIYNYCFKFEKKVKFMEAFQMHFIVTEKFYTIFKG